MVNFLAVGPPKCGTTFLQNVLIQHPGVFLSEKKEIQFFNYNFDKGFSWYFNHFQASTSNQLVGEISPTYCDSYKTLQRIKAYATDYQVELKIIFTYRDPVKRLLSEYYHQVRRANYAVTLEEAIDQELSGNPGKYFRILRNSRYGEIVDELYNLFGKENVLLLNSEIDLYGSNAAEGIRQVEKFLGLPQFTDYNFNVDSNASYTPKSHFVQKVVLKDNPLKKLLKNIVPSFALRSYIRRNIVKLNTKRKGYDDSLKVNDAFLEKLYEERLKDDFEHFQELLNDKV